MMKSGIQVFKRVHFRKRNFDLFGSKLLSANYFATSTETDENVRLSILSNALSHVCRLGWTQEAISDGAIDAGYSAITHSCISRGPVELVEYFIELKRKSVIQRVHLLSTCAAKEIDSVEGPTENFKNLSKIDKIAFILDLHLELWKPYVTVLPQAMALMLESQNFFNSTKLLFSISSDICEMAGIENSRMDWYTERACISFVYCLVEIYSLSDDSSDFADTKDFIRRSLQNIEEMMRNPLVFSFFANTIVGAISSFVQHYPPVSNKGR